MDVDKHKKKLKRDSTLGYSTVKLLVNGIYVKRARDRTIKDFAFVDKYRATT